MIHGTTDWFQIGKGVRQGYILSPCLFNLYAEYIMWNARLEESQAGTRLPGEISTTSDMQMIQLQWQKVKRYWAHKEADTTERLNWTEEEPKSLLMTVKKESKKAGLKFNIQNTKIMASGPITSWQIEEEKVEALTCFVFVDSKITAVGDCSHEIKRHLLLGRKSMTNLDSIFKSRDITLLTKVPIVKDMVFPVVMYGCES